MVSTSVLARRHACERVKHGGKSRAAEAAAGSRGPQGPGRRGQQAFLGTEGSALHSTLPGAWWTEPHQGPPLPGPGQGSRARALFPRPPPLTRSSHHKHWGLLTSWEASFPAEERTWQSGLCSHPCRDGPHSHQNVVALHFQTRPYIGPPFTLPLGTVLLCTV